MRSANQEKISAQLHKRRKVLEKHFWDKMPKIRANGEEEINSRNAEGERKSNENAIGKLFKNAQGEDEGNFAAEKEILGQPEEEEELEVGKKGSK